MQTAEMQTVDAERAAERAARANVTVTLLDVTEVLEQVVAESERRVMTPGAIARRMAHLLEWRAVRK